MNEKEPTCSCFGKNGKGETQSDIGGGVGQSPKKTRSRPKKAMGGAQWEKHGMTQSAPEYKVWRSMRYRCNCPNSNQFKHYGARGISVCKQWDSFTQFLKDMGRRPSRAYSIDRKNNNLGYCPHNCRWATDVEQNNNTRFNRFYDGKTIAELSRETGLSHACITKRVNSGLDVYAPLGIPKWPRRKR